jgi:hypothetical protein
MKKIISNTFVYYIVMYSCIICTHTNLNVNLHSIIIIIPSLGSYRRKYVFGALINIFSGENSWKSWYGIGSEYTFECIISIELCVGEDRWSWCKTGEDEWNEFKPE